jgi:hypothetical protein
VKRISTVWITEADNGRYTITKAGNLHAYTVTVTSTKEILNVFDSKIAAESYLEDVQRKNKEEDRKAARRERFIMHAGDIEWEPGTVPAVEIGPEGIEVVNEK